ncbi:hypothetical protein [Amycolatopsis sp. CA-126428]|uniref:hypothetical protein n=1 Tax=Amycolatopsis sp. CA-126428 TaxID=2073158 RepID=UPI0011B0044A|nr:hypothetical protein [Amycolatopsis sp. CA-126428]
MKSGAIIDQKPQHVRLAHDGGIEEVKMAAVTDFHEDLDNFADAGRFFVAVTERLQGAKVKEKDAQQLAHALRLPIPSGLKGASIEVLKDDHAIANSTDRTTVVISYPPVPTRGPEVDVQEFKKCFTVCKGVGNAKICATVCVDISVGMSGVHGSINASVSLAF